MRNHGKRGGGGADHGDSQTQGQFFDWMLARASNDRPSFAEGHAPCAVFNQLVRSRAQLLLLE